MLVNLFGRLSATNFSYVGVSGDIKYIAFPNLARKELQRYVYLHSPPMHGVNLRNCDVSFNGVYDTQKE
jgi:hypothetical protein